MSHPQFSREATHELVITFANSDENPPTNAVFLSTEELIALVGDCEVVSILPEDSMSSCYSPYRFANWIEVVAKNLEPPPLVEILENQTEFEFETPDTNTRLSNGTHVLVTATGITYQVDPGSITLDFLGRHNGPAKPLTKTRKRSTPTAL